MTLVSTWQQLLINWNGFFMCKKMNYTIVQHMPLGIIIYVGLKFRIFQKTLTHPIGQYLSQSNGHRQMAPLLTPFVCKLIFIKLFLINEYVHIRFVVGFIVDCCILIFWHRKRHGTWNAMAPGTPRRWSSEL